MSPVSPQAHFLISVDASNPEQVDTSIMREGLEQAVDVARNEGWLTRLEDETTVIGGIKVTDPSSPASALVLLLGGSIADTPDARAAAERLVRSLVRQYPRERTTILTEDERTTLLEGMAATRRAWEASDRDWINDVICNGYDGYGAGPDFHLLESAFCGHPVFSHLSDDAMRLGVLRILAKPQVLDFICSPEREQPVTDLMEFDQHISGAVGPMKAAGLKTPSEIVHEALQLHSLIVQGLEERLASTEDEEEQESQGAPQG